MHDFVAYLLPEETYALKLKELRDLYQPEPSRCDEEKPAPKHRRLSLLAILSLFGR